MAKVKFYYLTDDLLDTSFSESKLYYKKQPIRKNHFTTAQIHFRYTESPKGLLNYFKNNFTTINITYHKIDTLPFHLSYIQREGCDKDKSNLKTSLYGEEGRVENNFSSPLKKYEHKFFRIIISPEKNLLDLTDYTKYIVSQIERHTGYSLIWTAANHYNTDRHHTHLLIRGIDKKGKSVFLPRALIKTELRKCAMNYSNSILGEKTEAEILTSLTLQAKSKNVNQIDRSIYNKCKDRPLHNDRFTIIPKTKIELSRLKMLSGMGLADSIKINNLPAFQVRRDFTDILYKRQIASDVLKNHNFQSSKDIFRLPKNKTITVRVLSRVKNKNDHGSFDYIVRDEEAQKVYFFTSENKYELQNKIIIDSKIIRNSQKKNAPIKNANISEKTY